MKTIKPVSVDEVRKAQAPIMDTTLKVTCVYALNEGDMKNKRDEACALVGKTIIRRMKGLMPDAEVAIYPNAEKGVPSLAANDPDYPGDPILPVFESVMDADIFLFKTTTTAFGIATPSSVFFDRFNAMLKKYDGRKSRFSDQQRVADVVVVGGTGAMSLASCLLYMLNDLGFVIPAGASV